MTATPSAKEASAALALSAGLLLLLRWRKVKRLTDILPHSRTKPMQTTDANGNHVALTHSKIDTGSIIALVGSPRAGAVATFSGTTRDNFEGKQVVRLEYECYEEMAMKEMRKICQEIRKRWKVERVSITHRLGLCPVGEASVVIAVSSAHRAEALEGVSFAINTLKAKVPIWKKEVYAGRDEPSWKQNVEFKEG